MKNVSLCVAVLFAAVMVAMASVSFAGPDTITYQGCVLKPDGSTVANGAYVMRFGIFDAAEAGHALWTESNSSVQVSGGVFSVTLGAMNPFGSLFSSIRTFGSKWALISIETEALIFGKSTNRVSR